MAPPKKKFCKRGHDLDVTSKPMYTPEGAKNGRFCTACRKHPDRMEADRAWHRKKYRADQLELAMKEVFGDSGSDQ